MYLKISPANGVVTDYVGPYKICTNIGKVAYDLRLPTELASVHPVFHLSMLKKCICDPECILRIKGHGVKDKLSYEEVPVQIIDRQVNMLRNQEVDSVMVLSKNNLINGATWEAEADMKSRYPHLFDN